MALWDVRREMEFGDNKVQRNWWQKALRVRESRVISSHSEILSPLAGNVIWDGDWFDCHVNNAGQKEVVHIWVSRIWCECKTLNLIDPDCILFTLLEVPHTIWTVHLISSTRDRTNTSSMQTFRLLFVCIPNHREANTVRYLANIEASVRSIFQ